MAFCRTAVIERILNDYKQSSASNQSSITKSWNDMESFEEEHLDEVYQKLVNFEQQIWGKLVVMEKKCRSLKAYLRSKKVIIDGSYTDFNGLRLGLGDFVNIRHDKQSINLLLSKPQFGITLKIDESGDVWMKNDDGEVIAIGIMGKIAVGKELIKIFDLKLFTEVVSRRFKSDATDLNRLGITYILIDTASAPLTSSLWFALIHIAAIEISNILTARASNLSVPSKLAGSRTYDIIADDQHRKDERTYFRSPCHQSEMPHRNFLTGNASQSYSVDQTASDKVQLVKNLNRTPENREIGDLKAQRTGRYDHQMISRNLRGFLAQSKRSENGIENRLNLKDSYKLKNRDYFQNEREAKIYDRHYKSSCCQEPKSSSTDERRQNLQKNTPRSDSSLLYCVHL